MLQTLKKNIKIIRTPEIYINQWVSDIFFSNAQLIKAAFFDHGFLCMNLKECDSSEPLGTTELPPGMRRLFRDTTKSPPARVVLLGRDQTNCHMTKIIKQAAYASKTSLPFQGFVR